MVVGLLISDYWIRFNFFFSVYHRQRTSVVSYDGCSSLQRIRLYIYLFP